MTNDGGHKLWVISQPSAAGSCYTKTVKRKGHEGHHHYLAILLTALSFILIQSIAELILVYGAIAWSIDIATAFYEARYVLAVVHIALTIWLIVFAKEFTNRFFKHRRAEIRNT